MNRRPEVMRYMIAIIPADLIIVSIDTGYSIRKIILRIIFIYKSMLRPVTDHHYKTGKKKWNYEYPQSSFEIYKTHSGTKKKKGNFAVGEPHVHSFSFPAEQIHKRFPETKNKKIEIIQNKVPETIPLV
jgi:hypothetical protein